KKGPKFLTYDQLKALFSLNIIPSRYFVQRLMLVFGQVDCDLINMKIRNEISDYDMSLVKKTKSSWAEDVDFNVLNCILTKAHELYVWESMGYGDIVTDTNDLVLQGQFLLCYPPGSTFNYSIDIILDKFNYLYKLGYRLNIPLFSEIILLFMRSIDSIGNDILQICSKLMNRTAKDVLLDFLRLSMFSERDFILAQNFYISKYIYVKEAFMNSLVQDLHFLFQKLESILRSTYEKRDINIQLKEILPFKKNFLKWVLTTYNTTSNIVNEYFNFILHLRVIINIFEGSFANGMPLGFSMQDIEMIKELFQYF
ncbi:31122_t:CDS:2, partial [Racocetra persica]